MLLKTYGLATPSLIRILDREDPSYPDRAGRWRPRHTKEESNWLRAIDRSNKAEVFCPASKQRPKPL